MITVIGLAAMALSTGTRWRITNGLVSAPNGIAFISDEGTTFVVDPGCPYFAGEAAPDDTYHRTLLRTPGGDVTFEWGREGNHAIGRLTAQKSCEVAFDLSKNWPEKRVIVRATSDGAEASLSDSPIKLRLRTFPATAGKAEVAPDRPVFLTAGIGEVPAPNPSRIAEALETSAKRYQGRRPRAEGTAGDFLGAIADNLNNSRVYSTDNGRLAHTVARGWAHDANSAPYFCWDSFFNGALAILDDPETARETVRTILSYQTGEGLVPNYAHFAFSQGSVSVDRSQPPVGALCVWKMHQMRPNLAFLREVYPKLLRWHRWWPKARDGRKDGLLEWGSAKQGMQEALWETGWDDTVHFDGAKMAGDTIDAYAVDLNSLWAMDAEYLGRLADILHRKDDARELKEERERTLRLMNEKLWNPELGAYCSRLWDGRFLTRLTPMNLYPLIAGAPNTEQMLRMLQDPKRFWGDWVIPTVSRDDPAFPQQNYWRGKVWAPVNYLLFQGLSDRAPEALNNEFASKSLRLFMRNWSERNLCGENYLSTTGEQSSDPHYTWGALLCLIGLENIVSFASDGRVRLNGTLKEVMTLRNVPLHGRNYDVEVRPGETTLLRAGKAVMRASGKVEVAALP